MGIALSAALVAGIAPVTAIAAETSSPTGTVALQTNAASDNPAASSETLAAEKDKAYAAMQEALKNLEAAKEAASPEKLAEIDDDIAAFQELYDMVAAEAAKWREPLPAMQANVDAAQAKYDEAHNRTSGLQAELDKAIGDRASSETIKQLQLAIISAKAQEKSCKDNLHSYQCLLESQEGQVNNFESEAEEAKAHIDEDIAKRNALLGDLEKAQAAYDDACKAYEEAKAAADKATSPEITKPAETTKPSSSAQPAETAQPASFARDRQIRSIELHQASRYDRRQAREHGRHSTERNRTRRNHRRRTRNNHRSHTPHQELKIAARAYRSHQSTSP